MDRSSAARRMTGTEELLSVMSNKEINLEIAKPDTSKPHKARWQQIVTACVCLLVIAAATKGFLYLDGEISTVQSAVGSTVKDLNMLKAHVTAADTKEQLASVSASIQDLKAANNQLRAELHQVEETIVTLKTKKNAGAPAQRKRR